MRDVNGTVDEFLSKEVKLTTDTINIIEEFLWLKILN